MVLFYYKIYYILSIVILLYTTGGYGAEQWPRILPVSSEAGAAVPTLLSKDELGAFVQPTHILLGVANSHGEAWWADPLVRAFAGHKNLYAPHCRSQFSRACLRLCIPHWSSAWPVHSAIRLERLREACLSFGFAEDDVDERCVHCTPDGEFVLNDTSPAPYPWVANHTLLMVHNGHITREALDKVAAVPHAVARAITVVRDPRDVLYLQHTNSSNTCQAPEPSALCPFRRMDMDAIVASVKLTLPAKSAAALETQLRKSSAKRYCDLLNEMSDERGMLLELVRIIDTWKEAIALSQHEAAAATVAETAPRVAHAYVRFEDVWARPDQAFGSIAHFLFGDEYSRATAFTSMLAAAYRREKQMQPRLASEEVSGHFAHFLNFRDGELKAAFEHVGLDAVLHAYGYAEWTEDAAKAARVNAPRIDSSQLRAADTFYEAERNPSLNEWSADILQRIVDRSKRQRADIVKRWYGKESIFLHAIEAQHDGTEANLARLVLRAMRRGRFVIGCIGTSNAAGRDNNFNDSFTVRLAVGLAEWMSEFGVRVEDRNTGMSGHNAGNAIGQLDCQVGTDVDLIMYEFGMMDGTVHKSRHGAEHYQYEMFMRQAFMLPRQPAVINVLTGWGRPWSYTKHDGQGWIMFDHLDPYLKDGEPYKPLKLENAHWVALRKKYGPLGFLVQSLITDNGFVTVDHQFEIVNATKKAWHPSEKGHQSIADCMHYYILLSLETYIADLLRAPPPDLDTLLGPVPPKAPPLPPPEECEPEVCSHRTHAQCNELPHYGFSMQEAIVRAQPTSPDYALTNWKFVERHGDRCSSNFHSLPQIPNDYRDIAMSLAGAPDDGWLRVLVEVGDGGLIFVCATSTCHAVPAENIEPKNFTYTLDGGAPTSGIQFDDMTPLINTDGRKTFGRFCDIAFTNVRAGQHVLGISVDKSLAHGIRTARNGQMTPVNRTAYVASIFCT